MNSIGDHVIINSQTVKVVGKEGNKNTVDVLSTDYVVWKTAESRFNDLGLSPDESLIMGELYHRVRKLPDYTVPVVMLFPTVVQNITEKYGFSDIENVKALIYSLIDKEVILNVEQCDILLVVCFNRRIFLTNGRYYTELKKTV